MTNKPPRIAIVVDDWKQPTYVSYLTKAGLPHTIEPGPARAVMLAVECDINRLVDIAKVAAADCQRQKATRARSAQN